MDLEKVLVSKEKCIFKKKLSLFSRSIFMAKTNTHLLRFNAISIFPLYILHSTLNLRSKEAMGVHIPRPLRGTLQRARCPCVCRDRQHIAALYPCAHKQVRVVFRQSNTAKGRLHGAHCEVRTVRGEGGERKPDRSENGSGFCVCSVTHAVCVCCVFLWVLCRIRSIVRKGEEEGERLEMHQSAREQCTFGTMTGAQEGGHPTMQSYIHFVVLKKKGEWVWCFCYVVI